MMYVEEEVDCGEGEGIWEEYVTMGEDIWEGK